MQKTGESYASARRHLTQQTPESDSRLPSNSRVPWHFPGNVPATTALRVLLTHAGVRDPHTRQPFSEAMLFGIAGGIGIGVFSFFYEKADFASFFVGGRHLWQDDVAYFKAALERLSIKPIVKESTGAKPAEKQLREALKTGPCIAWVDAVHLPHRALPQVWSGGGYHVITIYDLQGDDAALIGDLNDNPVTISLKDLAVARERIKKQKNRILSIPASASPKALAPLVKLGLEACHRGLLTGGWKNVKTNFTLKALALWADRLHGSKDKESWERVFPPGHRLWRGLVSIYDFCEHYGTGGGLCRPLFADFFREAGDALKNASLRSLAEQYADLGRRWSELARVALPDDVPALRQARELHAQKAELTLSGAAPEEIRAVWKQIDELEKQARAKFPMSTADCAALRAKLQTLVQEIYEGEVAAHAALEKAATAL